MTTTVLYIIITALLAGYGYIAFKVIRKKVLDKRAAKRMTAYLSDQVQDYPLVHIYTDKTGDKWYAFKNPLKMPAMRTIAGEAVARQAEMNMTNDTLHKFLVSMEKDANAGNLVKMLTTVGMMKERLTWAFEEHTLLNLATTYFLLEGEEPTVISDEWAEKKRARITSDIEAKAFFLTAAYN